MVIAKTYVTLNRQSKTFKACILATECMPFFLLKETKAAPEKQDKTTCQEKDEHHDYYFKETGRRSKDQRIKERDGRAGTGNPRIEGVNTRILGLVGDTSVVDMRHIMATASLKCTAYSGAIQEANRKFHPNDTVVDVNGEDRWWKLPGDRRTMFY